MNFNTRSREEKKIIMKKNNEKLRKKMLCAIFYAYQSLREQIVLQGMAYNL